MNYELIMIIGGSRGGDALILNPPTPVNGFGFAAILITTYLLGGLLVWFFCKKHSR